MIAAAAKSLQLCPTLCDPIDGSPGGSPIPGILQVRTLEWVAISFYNARKWKVRVKSLSRVRLLATPWTAAHQAPPSMGFSRQEYWSGLALPYPFMIKSSLFLMNRYHTFWKPKTLLGLIQRTKYTFKNFVKPFQHISLPSHNSTMKKHWRHKNILSIKLCLAKYTMPKCARNLFL